ncbi:HNH endonuclease signature motif containing protein [Micromonospora hortensis]|uniref:HNH endonuclease signature motif containing protein n=1 Tax=Micromonospora hortensis TaxID=2911209 RepID=UPI001EE7F3EA|nr:HNH endonuclease signature motif containing protein [Micromonospora hortensis]MCG5449130.1 HNH endonuclease [Micromonospora hortensis]
MVEELALADDAVAACLDAAAWALPEHELIAALDAAHRLQQRLAAVTLTLVREIDGRGTARTQGASNTAVWLRERLRLTIPAARRLIDLSTALDTANPGIRQALADGAISLDQARVIADTATTVQATAGTQAADKAASLLTEWASQFDPTHLRKLGTRILDHVAPDIADAATQAALDAEARRAARDRHLTLSEQTDGRLRLTGTLDTETAGLLRAAIDPLTAPSGPDDTRSPGQRRHDALADVCRLALRTGELPDSGGDSAQIVITTTYDGLTRQLGAGALDIGLELTPDTVRRLACDATILPAVLGGTGQVLDVGRQRRLITGPLRRALMLRDRGCAFPGCDRPPRWCAAHHIHHWADGGTTNLDNAVLLCGHHHRHVHQADWVVRLSDDGHPEFIPPAWLDPEQLPRRNHYHRRT